MIEPSSTDHPDSEGSRRRRRKKLTAVIDPEHTLTLTGPVDTIDRFIELIDRLLSEAKRGKGQSLRLSTFLQVIFDRAEASKLSKP